MGDEGSGDAALVVVVLEEAEWGVFREGPAFAAEPVGVGFGGVAFGSARGSGFGIAAVVRHEEDQGIVEDAAFFETRNKIADGFVHAMDDGGVGGHEVVEAVLFSGGNFGPGLDGIGSRSFFPIGIDDSEFLLFRVATVADGAPADFVFAAKLSDFLGGGLEREMGGVVTEVEVKGFFLCEGFVDELEAEGGPEVGGIPILREARVIVGDGFAIEEEFCLV